MAAPWRERSRDEFASLLPQGLATPDNHLFQIVAGAHGVGYLWFAVERRHGQIGAFVYDASVHAVHRRQGHAERAFRALEGLVAEMGLNGIGLHVFSHNPAALALYRKPGYMARRPGLTLIWARMGSDCGTSAAPERIGGWQHESKLQTLHSLGDCGVGRPAGRRGVAGLRRSVQRPRQRHRRRHSRRAGGL